MPKNKFPLFLILLHYLNLTMYYVVDVIGGAGSGPKRDFKENTLCPQAYQAVEKFIWYH